MQESTDPDVLTLLPPGVVATVRKLIAPGTASGQVPAPPCVLQDEYSFQGRSGQYPRVEARK